MPRIVTALFEIRANAERALQALIGSGIARDRIAVVGEPGQGITQNMSFAQVGARDDTLAALHDLPLPGEDVQLFEQAIRRGHALLSARLDTEEMERAVATIEMFEPLDLDRRSSEWRGQHGGSGAMAGGMDVGAPLGESFSLTAGAMAGQTNTSTVPGMGSLTDATHDSGSADLQTGELGRGQRGADSTVPTGGRANQRAGMEGVLELAPGAARRDSVRMGRVWSYSIGDG
jgi:hypothetical protein